MESIKRNFKRRLAAIWDDPCAIFSIFGFVFTSLVGTLLHFLPDILQNNFIYLIAPTNESVWEHLKLLFYPYLIFMIAEYFAWGRETTGFLGAKVRGVIIGQALIVAAHYVYSGIIGKSLSWLDITLFFVGTAAAYIIPYLYVKRGGAKRFSTSTAIALFLMQIVLFSVFTFAPLRLGIFLDPQTGTYGIS